jgi:hypothetical protein
VLDTTYFLAALIVRAEDGFKILEIKIEQLEAAQPSNRRFFHLGRRQTYFLRDQQCGEQACARSADQTG